MPPRPKDLTKRDQQNVAKAAAAQRDVVKLTRQLDKARQTRNGAVVALLRGGAPAWQISQLTKIHGDRVIDLAAADRKATAG